MVHAPLLNSDGITPCFYDLVCALYELDMLNRCQARADPIPVFLQVRNTGTGTIDAAAAAVTSTCLDFRLRTITARSATATVCASRPSTLAVHTRSPASRTLTQQAQSAHVHRRSMPILHGRLSDITQSGH